MKKILFIALAGTFIMVSCKKKGCTDPLADNYAASAQKDNGTCKYVTNPWAPNNPNNPNPGGGNPGTSQTIEWTSNITTPTTVAPNTLVKVCANISISSSLILQEGVILEFCADKYLTITQNGSLTANGTASKNILFKGVVNTAGYWGGIVFKSNNPDNVMNHVQVLNGGSYYYYKFSNIYLDDNAQLKLSNSTIAGSQEYGLNVYSTANKLPGFSNNIFKSNGTHGVSVFASQLSSLDQNSNYDLNNTTSGIEVKGGTITNSASIKNLNTHYLVTDDIKIHEATSIVAGAKFKFTSNRGIQVSQNGSLSAIGTTSERILFEGASHAAGFWKGFEILSNNPQNILKYVDIVDAGSYYYRKYSGIYVDGSLSIDNSSVTNSDNWGIYVYAGSVIKTNGSAQTTVSGITANNDLSGNGAGGNNDCTNGCMVRFP